MNSIFHTTHARIDNGDNETPKSHTVTFRKIILSLKAKIRVQFKENIQFIQIAVIIDQYMRNAIELHESAFTMDVSTQFENA